MGMQAPLLLQSYSLFSAIYILIIVGVFVFLCLKRGNMSVSRIRAIPRGDSRMVQISSAFLVLTAIVGLIPTSAVVQITTSTDSMLPAHVSALTAIEPTIFTVVMMMLAGVALFFSGKHRILPPIASILLILTHIGFYGGFVSEITLMTIGLSLVFFLLSVIGWRRNFVPRFLAGKLDLPWLSLASALFALFALPQAARDLELYISHSEMPPVLCYLYMAVWLLPLVGLLLVNLASEARPIAKVLSRATVRAVPQSGTVYAIASWLLLFCGAANLLIALFTYYDTGAFLLTLPLVAAGLLLVTDKGSEKRFLAASVCLLLCVAVNFFNIDAYAAPEFLTYSIPILLMFISAIGALRNVEIPALSKITSSPILNIVASVLLIIGLLSGAFSTLEHNAGVRDMREKALTAAAEEAGRTVAYTSYVKQNVADTSAAFDEAKAAADTALENIDGLADENQLISVREEIVLAAEEFDNLRAGDKYTFASFDELTLAFAAAIGEASAEAFVIYEEASREHVTSITGKSGDSSAPVTHPSETEPQPETEEKDPFEIANNAIDAFYAAESAATSAVGRTAAAAEDAEELLTEAMEDIEAAALRAKQFHIPWYRFALNLLTPLGLILLNLSLGSREVESRGVISAFIHTSRRVFRWFYRDVGGKLQVLAKIQAMVCMVIACLSAITAAIGLCGFLVNSLFTGFGFENFMVFAIGIGGILASFILALPTWFLYAFGQITADVHEMKESGGISAPEYFEENPDDLPEL